MTIQYIQTAINGKEQGFTPYDVDSNEFADACYEIYENYDLKGLQAFDKAVMEDVADGKHVGAIVLDDDEIEWRLTPSIPENY